MPLDPNIYGRIDTQAPNRLAQIFDPDAIQARQLAQAQSGMEMQKIDRANKLQTLLGGLNGSEPGAAAQILGRQGFIDEAAKYQGLEDAAKQRKDADMQRKITALTGAHSRIGAAGGSDAAIDQEYGAIGLTPEQIASKKEWLNANIPTENRASYFLDVASPDRITKREEIRTKAIETGEQKAADREARVADDKARDARLDKQLAAQDRRAELQAKTTLEATDRRAAAAERILSGKPEKPLTEAQGNAALFGARADEADKILNGLGAGYGVNTLNAKRFVENVPGVSAVANAMLTESQQKADQAQRNFVNAVLRKESGAAISPGEFSNAQRQYFPQPGDSKAVIEQKAENRKTAITGLKVMSGPGAEQMSKAMNKEAPKANKPTVSNW